MLSINPSLYDRMSSDCHGNDYSQPPKVTKVPLPPEISPYGSFLDLGEGCFVVRLQRDCLAHVNITKKESPVTELCQQSGIVNYDTCFRPLKDRQFLLLHDSDLTLFCADTGIKISSLADDFFSGSQGLTNISDGNLHCINGHEAILVTVNPLTIVSRIDLKTFWDKTDADHIREVTSPFDSRTTHKVNDRTILSYYTENRSLIAFYSVKRHWEKSNYREKSSGIETTYKIKDVRRGSTTDLCKVSERLKQSSGLLIEKSVYWAATPAGKLFIRSEVKESSTDVYGVSFNSFGNKHVSHECIYGTYPHGYGLELPLGRNGVPYARLSDRAVVISPDSNNFGCEREQVDIQRISVAGATALGYLPNGNLYALSQTHLYYLDFEVADVYQPYISRGERRRLELERSSLISGDDFVMGLAKKGKFEDVRILVERTDFDPTGLSLLPFLDLVGGVERWEQLGFIVSIEQLEKQLKNQAGKSKHLERCHQSLSDVMSSWRDGTMCNRALQKRLDRRAGIFIRMEYVAQRLPQSFIDAYETVARERELVLFQRWCKNMSDDFQKDSNTYIAKKLLMYWIPCGTGPVARALTKIRDGYLGHWLMENGSIDLGDQFDEEYFEKMLSPEVDAASLPSGLAKLRSEYIEEHWKTHTAHPDKLWHDFAIEVREKWLKKELNTNVSEDICAILVSQNREQLSQLGLGQVLTELNNKAVGDFIQQFLNNCLKGELLLTAKMMFRGYFLARGVLKGKKGTEEEYLATQAEVFKRWKKQEVDIGFNFTVEQLLPALFD